ncbi:MAG: 2-C-methyl-D-erythritol 2,4-cyclodiphosphate synthase [Candidatus Sumerlaeota bacterium]|nr:2-C-methyl-D-erythritol 2,4-cyclodiphosphate synthase [Candidatus Sumerlaeota bacterium]
MPLHPIRIGQGFDVHAFATGRRLVLGGVEIPHEKGLLGHSDADALTHAVCDAILGALARGDIGQHFPDTDLRYKNIDSLLLLDHVVALAHQDGYCVAQIDATILAQRPRLVGYMPQMQEKLRARLGSDCIVNIKATTTEKLGFIGREEGIAAMAVAMLTSIKPAKRPGKRAVK